MIAALAIVSVAACLPVDPAADRIFARDLATAMPGIEAAGADTPVTFAPAPGVQRVLGIPELRTIAARLHVPVEPSADVCFERRTAPLDRGAILRVMQAQIPEARIEIIDYAKQPVPEGAPIFPRNSLRLARDDGYWSGYVQYGGAHRYAIWAKVRVKVGAWRVLATRDVKPGQLLDAAMLRLEKLEEPPAGAALLTAIDEAAGRIARRRIAAGTPIRADWLDAAKDVLRGDTVKVEARSGSAVLTFDALAETSGAAGQSILVLNPISRRRFRARVEGKGKVSVESATSTPSQELP